MKSTKSASKKRNPQQYKLTVRFGDTILDEGHTSVPNLILENYSKLGITATEMMFIIHLIKYKWTEKDPYPSLDKIAEFMGLKRRQMSNYTDSLRRKGYKPLKIKSLLVTHERINERGGQITNEYDFSNLLQAIIHVSKPQDDPPMQNIAYPPMQDIAYKEEEVKEEEIDSNSSKFEKNVDKSERREERGGGFKSFSEILEERKRRRGTASKIRLNRLPDDLEDPDPQPSDRISVLEKSPHKKPLREPTRLDAVMVKISQDIGDTKHKRENIKQAKNIFADLEKRGVTEDQFIDTLFRVKGLTVEVINNLDRPGAYFFTTLRDKWKVKATSPP